MKKKSKMKESKFQKTNPLGRMTEILNVEFKKKNEQIKPKTKKPAKFQFVRTPKRRNLQPFGFKWIYRFDKRYKKVEYTVAE